MKEIMRIDEVRQYDEFVGVPTTHPLVSAVDCREMRPIRHVRKLYNVYGIFIKDIPCGEMAYGQGDYEYGAGSLLFVAPGQVMGLDDDGEPHQPKGYALVFHPDLLRGSFLAKAIKSYRFFSYQVREALRLTTDERAAIMGCMERIRVESRRQLDPYTDRLIVDNIRMLLDYCARFYDTQFACQRASHDILTRFEELLDSYLSSGKLAEQGLPSVGYCASELCLSANYLSDLIKRQTGISALRHIHQRGMEVAKAWLADPSRSIGEISSKMGFRYPQHFNRWFKSVAGVTPNEYRHLL